MMSLDSVKKFLQPTLNLLSRTTLYFIYIYICVIRTGSYMCVFQYLCALIEKKMCCTCSQFCRCKWTLLKILTEHTHTLSCIEIKKVITTNRAKNISFISHQSIDWYYGISCAIYFRILFNNFTVNVTSELQSSCVFGLQSPLWTRSFERE